ncbi:hypothetical protein [Isoptericola aurantiacus]|uniref:hypothetical protein n=1 Tax=Isoptericola aurantiacus TaxID=3377839 RepID=UPI00383A4F10
MSSRPKDSRRDGAPDPPQAPEVLELRVHGVSNTPPAEFLGLAPDEVEPAEIDGRGVHGDDLGSFWQPSAAARERDAEPGRPTSRPRSVPRDGTHDPRRIPPGVRREVYSWGTMARMSWSVPGGWSAAAVVSGVVRLAWVALVPLGMVNVAYWARRIPTGQAGHHGGPDGRRARAYACGGAAAVRLVGLVLTLLLTVTALTVTLDLVGTQCMPDAAPADGGDTVRNVCTALPEVVQGLAFGPTAVRVAWLTAVPVAGLVGLWALARRTRVHHEERLSARKAGEPRGGAGEQGATGEQSRPRFPLLSTSGFWTHRILTRTGELTHLAAGTALVASVVGWSGAVSAYAGPDVDTSGCVRMRGFAHGSGCDVVAVWSAAPALVVIAAVAVLVGLAAAWRTARDSFTSADVAAPHGVGARVGPTRWALGLLVAAVVLWAAGLVALAVHEVEHFAVAGLGAAPTAFVAVLLGLSLCAVAWRSGPRSGSWFTRPLAHVVYLVVVLGCGAWAMLTGNRPSAGAAATGAVLLAVLLVRTWSRGRSHHREEAWWGTGPAVFLLLASGFAILLSALVVVGAHTYLRRPDGTATFELLRANGAEPPDGTALTVALTVPRVYEAFGVATGVALVVAVLAAAATVVRRLRWIARAPGAWSALDPNDVADRQEADRDWYGPADPGVADTRRLPLGVLQVLRMRQHAAAGQRAEIVVGWLAMTFLAALALSLATVVAGWPEQWEAWEAIVRVANPALGAAALLLASSVVAAGADGAGRPWGVLWDLMCFLPRAAHPLGPPCYAERVVPEVRGRIDAWLGALDLPEARRSEVAPRRRVVLAGHSNGGMLATAVVLARSDADQDPQAGLALLTFGTQLRGLFGRLFPELFGPAVLGTPPLRRPRFGGGDPWRSEVPDGPAPDAPTAPDAGPSGPRRGSLRQQLTGPSGTDARWRNLWRRTDFIGFPACSYAPNPIDRGAEELDPRAYTVRVWHHSEYPAAPAYREAFDELVAAFPPAPGRGTGAQPVTTTDAERLVPS